MRYCILALICGSFPLNAVSHIREFPDDRQAVKYFTCREKLCSAIKIISSCMLQLLVQSLNAPLPTLNNLYRAESQSSGLVNAALGSLHLWALYAREKREGCKGLKFSKGKSGRKRYNKSARCFGQLFPVKDKKLIKTVMINATGCTM